MVGDRDAQRTKHLASEFHASAVTAETYRHRDDTPHAVTGPLGCYVCAKLRQFEREGS